MEARGMTLGGLKPRIVRGDATATAWLKCGLNYCVPFVVSNLGLLAGKRVDGSYG